MKLSFFEKILAEYKASKKESLLILVIMLTVSVSIGLSCIMLNSQQIERSLMKNIDIRLELEGGSIFDCVYNGDEYALLTEVGQEADENGEECIVCKVETTENEDGEEDEEFVLVEDETLAGKLIEIANTRLADDEEE